MTSKYAAHEVRLSDGNVLRMAVVTVVDGEVAGCHCLQGEEPMTQWIGGTIVVKDCIALHEGQILR